MDREKLRVMIVDDEKKTRNLLRMCIDWEEFGLTIINDASGAFEALDILKETIPDIMFIDICMPYIDGLELSRKVSELYPFIKIVILTGHGEFKYAKEGINIGVYEFLEKPIIPEKIENVAKNLYGEIIKERDFRDEYHALKKQIDEQKNIYKEKFLNGLLTNVPDKILRAQFKSVDLIFSENSYQIAVFEIRENINEDIEKLFLKRLDLQNEVETYFKYIRGLYIFRDNKERTTLLINNDVLNLEVKLDELIPPLAKLLGTEIIVGIGNKYTTENSIKDSYSEASNAISFSAITGWNTTISYNEIEESNYNSLNSVSEYEEALKFSIKSGMDDRSHELIKEIINIQQLKNLEPIAAIRSRASSIMAIFLQIITEKSIRLEDIFIDNEKPFINIFLYTTLHDIEKYLLIINRRIHKEICKKDKSRNQDLINQIMEYMEENISNWQISQSFVADKFSMNPSYLSRFFKKKTGQTFIEYLTELRMNKVKFFLKSTNLKAYEIADKVGIQDPQYFSVLFKKYTGVSISDYRNNIMVNS